MLLVSSTPNVDKWCILTRNIKWQDWKYTAFANFSCFSHNIWNRRGQIDADVWKTLNWNWSYRKCISVHLSEKKIKKKLSGYNLNLLHRNYSPLGIRINPFKQWPHLILDWFSEVTGQCFVLRIISPELGSSHICSSW